MSMNASTAGLRVLRHVLGMPQAEAVLSLSKAKPYLTYEEEIKAFDYIRTHFVEHGAMPHPDTLLDQITVFLPPIVEPYAFDYKQLKHRFIEEAMRAASDKATLLISEQKQDEALKSLITDLLPVTQGQIAQLIFDLRETDQNALVHYLSQLDGTAPLTQKIGYPTLDEQGGIEDGDMLGIVGRPGSGKTWLMLSTALNFWNNYSEPVLFVTQEMSASQIEKRALPMVAGVDPTPMYMGGPLQYKIGGHTQEQYVQALKDAASSLHNKDVPFLLYDSKMAGTMMDIETIAQMHGVKRIWLDGAYMLRHPDTRLGRYARVPENLDLMKQYCQRSGSAIFSSWQFKKGAGKIDEEGTTPDLDDIGYSHAIGEYMGVILGLLENPKSLNQLTKKKVNVMKGRNGEEGQFSINWRFDTMDFSEVTGEAMSEDLTYL